MNLAVALLLAVSCFAQGSLPDESSTAGNVYTNFFFRFRYSFTSSWVPQTAGEAEQLPQSVQVHFGDDGGSVNAGKHYYLLTLQRNLFGLGVVGHDHAIISLVAEDVSGQRDLTSGKECVFKLAENLKKAHYTAVGEPKAMQISRQTFFRQDMLGASSPGVPVYESVVFTVNRGYAVGFVLVAPNQTMLASMENTLRTVEFY